MATLEGWLVPNTVTVDDTSDKILEVHPKEGYTNTEIVDLMMKEITGLKRETLNHAVELYNRIISESLLEGHSVNTGLFYASPSFKGIIENNVWNPEKNSIVVNFQTGKTLREEITKTKVEILGEKAAANGHFQGQEHQNRGRRRASGPLFGNRSRCRREDCRQPNFGQQPVRGTFSNSSRFG